MGKRPEKRPYEYGASPEAQPRFSRSFMTRGFPQNRAAVLFLLKWAYAPFIAFMFLGSLPILIFPHSELAREISGLLICLCVIPHSIWVIGRISEYLD